jgi:hypothetical protein
MSTARMTAARLDGDTPQRATPHVTQTAPRAGRGTHVHRPGPPTA